MSGMQYSATSEDDLKRIKRTAAKNRTQYKRDPAEAKRIAEKYSRPQEASRNASRKK